MDESDIYVIWTNGEGQNVYADKNNNLSSVEFFGSDEAAIKALESLRGCKDCIDCYKCVHCFNGVELVDCVDCIRCFWSSHCDTCLRCKNIHNRSKLYKVDLSHR